MKSILIIGTKDAGKSTTMREVCKRLNPSKVHRLITDTANYEKSTIQESAVEDIFNDSFIIEVKGKMILVVAGAPTEQRIRLTVLIEICIAIKIDIEFLLVSKRLTERIAGFNTLTELEAKSDLLLSERIFKINAENFAVHEQWNQRIDKIVKLINDNI